MYRQLGEITSQNPYVRETGSMYSNITEAGMFVKSPGTEQFRFRRYRQDTGSSTGSLSTTTSPSTNIVDQQLVKESSDSMIGSLQKLQQQLSADVDCKVQWGEWSSCFMDNGKYIQSRRAAIQQYPRNNGAQCPPLVETQECKSNDCQLSEWSVWSPCFVDDDPSHNDTYGKYVRLRTRTVISPPTGNGAKCGNLIEMQSCAPIGCERRDLSETESPWSLCAPKADGTYEQVRVKYQVTSPPQNGGTCYTTEELLERRSCGVQNCVVGTWSELSGCYKDENGKYVQMRTRSIVTPAQNGGTCNDPLTQTNPCNPVDCQMTDWSAFSQCYLNPDDKWYRLRTREITTSSRYGGQECGPMTDEQLCPAQDCTPIGEWTDYGQCYTKEDGLSYKTQTRDFDDGYNGGRICTDSDFIREVRC